MSVLIKGIVSRFTRALAGESDMRLSNYGSIAVAQVEPEGADIARGGLRFGGGAQNGATGRAPTATLPTTTAQWLLWNGEPDGGKGYFLDLITILQLSGTAAVGGVVLCGLTTTKIAGPTAATGYATASLSRGTPQSKAVWGDAVTLAAAPTWVALAGNGNPATTTNGGASADVKGRICIPPGYGLAMHYLSGTGTTPLFLASAVWDELALDLE